jgi:hypothetical protein
MQRLEVGKLYSCSGYFLMLYPDKETADASDARASAAPAAARAREEAAEAGATVAYWRKWCGKPVSYLDPKTPLLVLNKDKKYVEVLAGDKKGWIINEDWLNIKEIV